MSLGIYTTERNKATTEWDDIQRRIGNLPPLDAGQHEVAEVLEVLEVPNVEATLANDEEEELERLRKERLDELRASAHQPRYGKIALLSRTEYVAEVNQAGEGIAVVVFLHKARHYLSAYMQTLLEQLARKYGHVKFLQIDADDCIPGYPTTNLPTLFVYRDDDLLRQCVGPAAFGGSSFGVDGVSLFRRAPCPCTLRPPCPPPSSSASVCCRRCGMGASTGRSRGD